MRFIALLSGFLLISVFSNAGELSIYPEYQKDSDECLLSAKAYGHKIVKKIDKHLYELKGDGMTAPPRSLLKTKHSVFDKTGVPVAIGIKRGAEMKEVPLENGFTASYVLWEECGVDVSLLCVPSWDPNGAWPKKPKDLDCEKPEKYIDKITSEKKKKNKK